MRMGVIHTTLVIHTSRVILSEAKDLLVRHRYAAATALVTTMLGAVSGCAGAPPPSPTPTPATPLALPATAAPRATAMPTTPPSPAPSATATPAPTATRTAVPTPVPSRTPTAVPSLAPSPAALTPAPTRTAPAPPYARITTADGRQLFISLEVADTPQKQMTGLMNRRSMPEDSGMLFIFPSDGRIPFWMKDTLLPLSIAFISQDGRILEIQDMQPLSEALHTPAQAYRYALEVNQGYFARHGAAVGDRIEYVFGGSS